MIEQKYDLAIIGSGPGGYVAAIKAAQINMNVVVIEKKDLGGICLNWGCIPTKALLRSSEIYDFMKNSSTFGLKIKNAEPDINNIIKRSRDVAKKLSNGIDFLFKKNNINLIYGSAKINKNKEIEVKNSKSIKKVIAKNIIIATGASPKKLNIENNHVNSKVWSYFEAMAPKKIPKTIGIIGSGAIGIEFASFFNSLGSNVSVFEMQQEILPNEDNDVSEFLRKSLSKKGISFYTNSNIIDIKENKTFIIKSKDLKSGSIENHDFENVLAAVGIRGNTENLGLENTKVTIKNNQIVTHDFGSTDEENIYAIGDVTGAPWLAHKASHEGISCVEYIAGIIKSREKMVIPSCVYSNPQVASIGLTEKIAMFP